jgi:hypothetical protein
MPYKNIFFILENSFERMMNYEFFELGFLGFQGLGRIDSK